MRLVTIVAAFLVLAGSAMAQPAAGWIADPRTGCQVWNDSPVPSESITWSGGCNNRLAQGAGVLQWFENGKPASRYEGEFREGKLNGRGTYVYADGARYEGSFQDDRRSGQGMFRYADGFRYEGAWSNGLPNGIGIYRKPDGSVIAAGTWTRGCFKEGRTEAAFLSSMKRCGFE
jgi:hypothetical protein